MSLLSYFHFVDGGPMSSYPQMVQQRPMFPFILSSLPPSILAYWCDNGYKLMKPLSVLLTRGWVGTQTLHHPVALINQTSPSPDPSLQTAWHTARGSNVILCVCVCVCGPFSLYFYRVFFFLDLWDLSLQHQSPQCKFMISKYLKVNLCCSFETKTKRQM